jgi:hypothetical protein
LIRRGGLKLPKTNRVPRLEAPAPRPRKYAFFRFQTGKRLASAYGCCSGQVDRRTGEILATITYGLFQYRETFKLNLSDPVHSFPYTIEGEIICAARKAVRLGGPMTRRRVVFVRKDGRRYITEEFNGDKAEYAARGDCLDGCDLDWAEIRALFVAADTYLKFIKANLTAQAAYHSFLGEGGNAGVVRTLRKGRKLPPADSVLFIYEQPTADGDRFLEQEMTEG